MNVFKSQVLCLLTVYVASLILLTSFLDLQLGKKFQLAWKKYHTFRTQLNLRLICLDLEGRAEDPHLNQSFAERCQFLESSLQITLARDESVEKEAVRKTKELSQLVQHVTEFQFLVQSNVKGVDNLLHAFRQLAVMLEDSLTSNSSTSQYYVEQLNKEINYDLWYLQEKGDCTADPVHLCHFPPLKKPFGFGYIMTKTLNCLNEALVWKGRLLLDTSPEHPKHLLSLTSYKCEDLSCKDKLICNYSRHDTKLQYVPTKYQKMKSHSIFDVMTNPSAWYFGMLARYLMRDNAALGKMLHARARSYGIEIGAVCNCSAKNVTAGIYMGRVCSPEKSTKIDLSRYLLPVEEFFKRSDIKAGYPIPRRVFISTDDLESIEKVQKGYPEYIILYNDTLRKKISSVENITKNNCENNFSYDGNFGDNFAVNDVLLDTLLLANVDFFVGTMSSSVSRLVFSLRTANFPLTAHLTSISLDVEWYRKNFSHHLKAVQDHVVIANVTDGQIGFSSGSKIEAVPAKLVVGKHMTFWPRGFIFGRVVETGNIGLIPRFKTVTDIEIMSA